MSDEYIFQTATATPESTFEFMRKDVQFAPDNNQGSYQSGQVTFDLQQFANNSRYVSWKESHLAIPLVLNLNSPNGRFRNGDNEDLMENHFACSLKNGVHQLIHSCQIKLTNNEIISTTNFKNLEVNYKLLTEMNQTDLDKIGSTILFSPDTASSFRKDSDNQNRDGAGVTNNRLASSGVAQPFLRSDINEGRLKRMRWTSINPAQAGSLESELTTATKFQELWKSGVVQCSDTHITYHILAIIPMRFLADYFEKVPLMKNAYYQLVINTNTNVYSSITCAINGGNVVTAQTQISFQSPNGVVPFMVSPACHEAEAPIRTGLRFDDNTGSETYTVSLEIARSRTAGVTPHPLSQCRIYASMVTMTPMYEEIYLKNKLKRVLYTDYLSYSGGALTNISVNNSINHILTSGVSRLRKLIIYPFINQSENNGVPVISSPFTTEPATCSPYCSLSQFNVSLSSSPIYEQNQNYNFENYLHEVYPCGAINGGLTLGMNSGLISQHDFDTAYGMVVVDLSRHLPSEDDISRSVSIQFTNKNRFPIDVICLIVYEKELTIDCELGALVI
jgi:hypothetical protein